MTWRRIAPDPDSASIRDARKTFTNCCRSVGRNVNGNARGVKQRRCIRAAIVEDVGLQLDDQQAIWRNDCAGWNDGLWSARRIIIDPPAAHVEWRVAAVNNFDPFRSARRSGHEFVDKCNRRVGGVYRTGDEHPQQSQECQHHERPAHNPSCCKHRTCVDGATGAPFTKDRQLSLSGVAVWGVDNSTAIPWRRRICRRNFFGCGIIIKAAAQGCRSFNSRSPRHA